MRRDEEEDDFEAKPRKRQKLLSSMAKIPTEELEDLLRSRDSKSSPVFSAPASAITKAQFRQRYGLLTHSHIMPAYDRFRRVEMSNESLHCVSGLMAGDAATSVARLRVNEALSQQQFSPILDRFLRTLGRFTRPLPSAEEEPVYGDARQAIPKKAGLVVQLVENADEVEDSALFSSAEDPFGSEEEDQLGLFLDGQVSSVSCPRQHADFKLYVHVDHNTVNGLRLKIVDDLKTLSGERDLFQSAVYALHVLEETSKYSKRYRPPVYLLAQDKNNWHYAILEVDGYIRVKKGEIDPSSLQAFPEKPEPAESSKFTASPTRAQVVESFRVWKEEMAAEALQIPESMLHPVGRIFYRLHQGYEVPRLSARQAPLLESQKKFYDGILKIVVGRRVIKWSPQDVTNLWNASSFMAEALETAGCSQEVIASVIK